MYIYVSKAARLKIWGLGCIISIIFMYTHCPYLYLNPKP